MDKEFTAEHSSIMAFVESMTAIENDIKKIQVQIQEILEYVKPHYGNPG